MTDPIADMLTRVRNALAANKETVEVPSSNMKKAIADILLKEGYVSNVTVTPAGKATGNLPILDILKLPPYQI